MKANQGAVLDRKKLLADPVMVTTIVLIVTFLTLFILYPLAILLADSFITNGSPTIDVFKRVLSIPAFDVAFRNTLKIAAC